MSRGWSLIITANPLWGVTFRWHSTNLLFGGTFFRNSTKSEVHMNRMLVSSALAAAVALTLAAQGGPAGAADPAMEKMMKESGEAIKAGKIEKCYGVAQAGKNDCQTATASCAGSSKKDFDKSAFVALPTGTCSKLGGGSLEAS